MRTVIVLLLKLFCFLLNVSVLIWILDLPSISWSNNKIDKAKESSPSYEQLEALLFSQHSTILDVRHPDVFEAAILNIRSRALPLLAKKFDQEEDEEQRYLMAYGIAVIGGKEARDILKVKYNATGDSTIRAMLCLSMGSTRESDDTEFLSETLAAPDRDYELSPAIEQAAYSLGVMRYTPAIDTLREVAKEDPQSFSSGAAELALMWMTRPLNVRKSQNVQPEHFLEVILTCCPPVYAFLERPRNVLWKIKDGTWIPSLSSMKRIPSDIDHLSYSVRVAEDGQRGIATVRVDSTEYKYLLSQDHGRWNVVNVMRGLVID